MLKFQFRYITWFIVSLYYPFRLQTTRLCFLELRKFFGKMGVENISALPIVTQRSGFIGSWKKHIHLCVYFVVRKNDMTFIYQNVLFYNNIFRKLNKLDQFHILTYSRYSKQCNYRTNIKHHNEKHSHYIKFKSE